MINEIMEYKRMYRRFILRHPVEFIKICLAALFMDGE